MASEVARLTKNPKVGIVHLPMRPGEIPGDKVTANPDTLFQIGMNPLLLVGLEEGVHKTVMYFIESEGETWQKP